MPPAIWQFDQLSFDLGQLAANLLVGRAFLVIHLDKSPAHGSFWIDHVGRRVRPAFAVRVKNAVAVNHFVIFVFEEWEIKFAVEAFAEHLAEFFGFVVIVDTNGEYLDFFFLRFGQ
jgi:hypothetical protein